MTIKKVEQDLQVPRATIRFYEKEGLLSPNRSENRYRDYSDEDVTRLREIIIFRKLGISVTDISDVYDGANTLSNVLENNISNLEKQMEDLKGAISVCKKLQADNVEISDFDSEYYWNVIEEEEKRGNNFMTIAKDIADTEKKVFASWFVMSTNPLQEDQEEYSYSSKEFTKMFIREVIFAIVFFGTVFCIDEGWSVKNFLTGLIGIVYMLIIEAISAVPMYFLGKKYPWVARHRTLLFYVIVIVSSVLVAVVLNIID